MPFSECLACGGPLPPRARSGPPRSYCSGACRSAASRARRSPSTWQPAAFEPYRPQAGEAAPAVPSEALELLADVVPGQGAPADPVHRLAVWVLSLTALWQESAALAPLVPPQLRWRVESATEHLGAALEPFEGVDAS